MLHLHVLLFCPFDHGLEDPRRIGIVSLAATHVMSAIPSSGVKRHVGSFGAILYVAPIHITAIDHES
jgi:hypothetical protein